MSHDEENTEHEEAAAPLEEAHETTEIGGNLVLPAMQALRRAAYLRNLIGGHTSEIARDLGEGLGGAGEHVGLESWGSAPAWPRCTTGTMRRAR